YSHEALLRNLPHIRAIYFNDPDSQDQQPSSVSTDLESLLLQCRNLTMLELYNMSDEMMTFLEHNRNTIQRIIYHANYFKAVPNPIWDILGSMPRLRHLELLSAHIGAQNPSQGEAFVKICERLETMRLMYSKRLITISLSQNPLTTSAPGPVLEDLTWYSGSGFPTQDFIHHLCWTRSTSCLKKLNLRGSAILDADSAAIITQLPASCNHLTFDNSHFGALSITALAAAPLRRDLSLTFTRDIRNHLTLGLVSHCPNLQYLLPSCQVIATDLLTAPWVASRLVKLKLTLSSVDELPSEMGHSVVYEQLSRLVLLQELCLLEVARVISIGSFEQGVEIPEGPLGYAFGGWLDFSLENGMGMLASLSQLRRLDLRSLQVLRIGQSEALWMTTHWPALTSLYVRGLNHDRRQQRKVLKFLGKRRPELDITIGLCKIWHRALEPQLWHTVRFAGESIFELSEVIDSKIPARTITPIFKSYSHEALLRNLQHIRALYFSHLDSQDQYPSSSSSSSSSAPSHLESLLLQCRSLTMFQFQTFSDEMEILLEHNRNTIQRIVYHSHSLNALLQKPIWDILGSMTRLRHLELQFARVGAQNPNQGEAFVKIFERLETMHLMYCTLCDWPSFGQGQQGRFQKMKQLEFMFVNEPFAQLQMIRQFIATDLLTAPWVASRLVKLKLTISSVDELPPELGHSVIYEQLSRLVSLQELRLHEIETLSRWGRGDKLDFSLKNGMGVLASLTQLRLLDLRSLQVLRIGQPEALWMTTYWPALTSLYVRGLNHDSRQQRKVLKFLGQRRPELDITSRY
ncbi:hypothetical protein BGZ58_001814, partial [Dissophora ornata]